MAPSVSPRLQAVLTELAVALKAWQMYPSKHPAAREAAARLHEAVERLWSERESLVVAAARDDLMVDGEAVERPTPIQADLARHLNQRGVAAVSLQRGAALEELQRLLEFLVQSGEVPADGASPGPHVRVIPLQLEQLLVQEGAPAGEPAPPESGKRWQEAVATLLSSPPVPLDAASQRLMTLMARHGRFLKKLITLGERYASVPLDPSRSWTALGLISALCELVAALPQEEKHNMLERLTEHLQVERVREAPGPETAAAGSLEAMMEQAARTHMLDVVASLVTREGKVSDRLVATLRRLAQEENHEVWLHEVRRKREAARSGSDPYPPEVWERLEQLLLSRTEQAYMPRRYATTLEHLSLDAPVEQDPQGARLLERFRSSDDALQWQRTLVLLELLQQPIAPSFLHGVLQSLAEDAVLYLGTGQYERTLEVLQALRQAASGGGDAALRAKAAEALASVDAAPYLPELLALEPRDEPHPLDRLLELHPDGVVPGLLDLLAQEPRLSVRRALMDRIASTGAAALPHITARLKPEPWYLVRNLAHLMGRLGDRRAVPHLLGLLEHSHEKVRAEALEALVRLKAPEAVPVLEALVTADTWIPWRQRDALRLKAVRGLQQIGGPEARRALERGSRVKRRVVREACRKALEGMP